MLHEPTLHPAHEPTLHPAHEPTLHPAHEPTLGPVAVPAHAGEPQYGPGAPQHNHLPGATARYSPATSRYDLAPSPYGPYAAPPQDQAAALSQEHAVAPPQEGSAASPLENPAAPHREPAIPQRPVAVPPPRDEPAAPQHPGPPSPSRSEIMAPPRRAPIPASRGDARATQQAPAGAATGQAPAARQAPARQPPLNGQAAGRHPGTGGTARQGGAGRHRRAPDRQASYREVFAIREFRGMWAAQVLSYGGDQFAQVAIAILVYHQTHSPFLTALAYAFTYLPPIIGGPFLSGLADFIPRRQVMIACDVIRAGLVGLMAIPGIPLPLLCALLFATVLLSAPFSSARTAMLPDVLPGDKFVLGSAIGNMTFQACQVLGFVAGAAVVVAINPYRTLGLDAVTFAVSALILMFWTKRRPAPRSAQASRPSLWSITRDGAKLVFGHRILRTLVLFGWLAGFYVLPEGLAAPYAHSLGGGTMAVGLLMAAIPVGTVISALVLARFVRPSGRLRIMGWLAILSCAPLIGCALQPPLGVVLVLWMLSGLGSGYQLAAAAAFVQSVPDTGRALAFGLAQSGLLAAQGLGILIGGAAAQLIGPAPVVAIAGAVGLCAATLLTLGWRHMYGQVIANVRARTEMGAAETPAAAAG
jgi:MFS family permease